MLSGKPGRTNNNKKSNENTTTEEMAAVILQCVIFVRPCAKPLTRIISLILRNFMRFHNGPHFADEKTGSERLSNLPKVTELMT